jgi:hypothetical protein
VEVAGLLRSRATEVSVKRSKGGVDRQMALIPGAVTDRPAGESSAEHVTPTAPGTDARPKSAARRPRYKPPTLKELLRGGRPNESLTCDYLEFEVSLKRIQPRIWRRFQLKSDATMKDLHQAIQDAFGWLNYHLWEFRDGQPWRGKVVAGLGGRDEYTGERIPHGRMKAAELFPDPGSKLTYVYDFGDEWVHEVKLRTQVHSTEVFRRRLIAGKRAAPPEDCGGPYGYQDMVAIVKGELQDDESAQWIDDWDPEGFSLVETKLRFDRRDRARERPDRA